MEPFPHHGQAMTQAKPYKIPESVLVVIHSPDQYVLLIERADQPGFWQSVTGSKDASMSPCRRPPDAKCRKKPASWWPISA
jgi:dATP pyrophosphohydrolase